METQFWFKKLINKLTISATKNIFSTFKNSKFLVIKHEIKKDFVERKIAFLYGPYLLCLATNKFKIVEQIKEWVENKAYVPLGKFLSKNLLNRKLISKGKNYRKFEIKGDTIFTIKETFFPLKKIKISAFCGVVNNSIRDVNNAKKICSNKKSDFYLFPEAFPFSRMKINTQAFPKGAIFGGYSKNGPVTYFKSNKNIPVNKNTRFANEKSLFKNNFNPTIIKYNGLKICVLICYDLMNPKVSSFVSENKVDAIFIPAMIPKKDILKWKSFVYLRGIENMCPVVLASAKDKRDITNAFVISFDPITEKVRVFTKPTVLSFLIGQKITASPDIHWSWLLKNNIFGPFSDDY